MHCTGLVPMVRYLREIDKYNREVMKIKKY